MGDRIVRLDELTTMLGLSKSTIWRRIRQQSAPALSVDPATVPYLGGYDFAVTGSGFMPRIALFLVVCTIPGDPVTPQTPAEDLAAAMAQIRQDDCDLGNTKQVSTDPDGAFTVRTRGTVGATNFAWVASNSAQTEVAAIPIFAETQGHGPGVWVRPAAGVVPPTFPVCEIPPYGENCIPPSEWQSGEVTPNQRQTIERVVQEPQTNRCRSLARFSPCHRLLSTRTRIRPFLRGLVGRVSVGWELLLRRCLWGLFSSVRGF